VEGRFSPLLRAERGEKAVGGFRHHRNRVDVVVYASRCALIAVLKTVAPFARNQTASQDRSGQTEKRTSFDLAHKLPFQKSSGQSANAQPA
jgi:hypothetical protein